MRIDDLEWDDWNIEHISRHHVRIEEVHEVCESPERLALRIGKSRYGLERYQVFGQTTGGRFLVVILDRVSTTGFYVVTARDMTGREKQRYRRRRK